MRRVLWFAGILMFLGLGLLAFFAGRSQGEKTPALPTQVQASPQSATKAWNRPLAEIWHKNPTTARLFTLSSPPDPSGDHVRQVRALSTWNTPLTAEEIHAFHAFVCDSSRNHSIRNEVLNVLERQGDLGLCDVLEMVLDNPTEKGDFRAYAMQHLGSMMEECARQFAQTVTSAAKMTDLVNRCRRFLQDPHPAVRRQTLANLLQVEDPTAIAMVPQILESGAVDPCAIVAVRYVGDKRQMQYIPRLCVLAYSGDLALRIAAVCVLGHLGDPSGIPAATEAASHPDAQLAATGRLALKRLAPNREPPKSASVASVK